MPSEASRNWEGMVTKWLQKGVMEMAEPLTKFDRSQVALSIEVKVPGTGPRTNTVRDFAVDGTTAQLDLKPVQSSTKSKRPLK